MSNQQKTKQSKSNYLSAIIILVVFMILYWLFDVLVDVYIFKEATFTESFFRPDPMCLAMRLINLPIIFVCLIIAQWMYYKRKAAEKEIEYLREIIPICSYCKGIRNDQGYYEQVEKYMSNHVKVDFSHTICPSCMQKNYPAEYESIMNDESPQAIE